MAAKSLSQMLAPLKEVWQIKEFRIDPGYNNGSFEAALWSQKLSGDQCPEDDATCQQYGYKMSGMTGYLWSYLVAR